MSTCKRIYLSGPMSGRPYYNFPAFDYAAQKLREEGHQVFSPADNDRRYGLDGDTTKPFPEGVTANVLMKDDCNYILTEAECIALLPGHETSKGADVEKALAKFLGLTVITLGKEYLAPPKYVNDWRPH